MATALWLGVRASGADPAPEAPEPSPARAATRPALHPMEVRNPPSLGTVDTGLRDASGGSAGIPCATCHAPNDDAALAALGEVPKDFHGGIALTHGSLVCASCHAPDDRSRLRLAHGETIAMGDVLELCGQCHGSQRRDFDHGAHGGGRGYWDRTRGPWVRNACVACHAPHAPAYPLVMPAPPPNDRFLPAPPPRRGDAHERKGDAHERKGDAHE